MDLKHLQHLVALADERHFARAAGRVHLSQPAFSRSIRALEDEAGLPLFDRDAGRPTPAGEFVVERARRLLFDARCLRRDVDLYRSSDLGDTAFGMGPFPATTLLPGLLLALRARHPDVRVRVEVSNWALLVDRLVAEDIEFFASDVRDVPDRADLVVDPLGRQAGGLYVRAGHPLAGRPCRLDDAWRYGVAATRLPVAVQGALARMLGVRNGSRPLLALECDDVGILRGLALTTDTVCAVTHAAVSVDVAAGTLVKLAVEGLPDIPSEMGIVQLRDRTPSPLAARAMDLLRDVAARTNEGLAAGARPPRTLKAIAGTRSAAG